MPAVATADDATEQIRARADLVELVREHVRLRPVGPQFTGLCPFHQEKTASFRVTPQTQTWHCFGCDRGGDVFEFVMLIEKTDFKGALQTLADRTGIELVQESSAAREKSQGRRRVIEMNAHAARFYEYVLHSTPTGEPGRELLEKRGVSKATAERFGLGFAPAGGSSLAQFLRSRDRSISDATAARLIRGDQDFFRNRLIVPIRDERGQVVAFVGRTVSDDPRKYVNSPETAAYSKGRVLFGLDLAREGIGTRGHAVLVEGQFDCIIAHQFGVDNAIATSGTALTEDQVRLLKRFTDEVLLAFDGDSAGRAAALRAIEVSAAAGLRTRVLDLGGAKDPDEFLRAGGDWEKAAREAPPEWEYWIRGEISGLNPMRPRDLEIALDRIYGVLARIGDPAVRDAYRLKSAEWLGIEPRLMNRAVKPGRPTRGSDPPPPPEAGPDPAPRRPALGRNLSVGQHLLSVIVVRPEALERVRAGVSPEDFAEDDRRTYQRIGETFSSGGLEALQAELGEYDELEQELIRRAWANPPPRVDDEIVDELSWRLRLESLQSQLRTVKRRLGEAEQRGDRDQVAFLVVEDRRLGQAVTQLKSSKGR
ncbi:MAG: DNA primase [Candidatus Dormibacteraceae bacterium]